MPLTLLTSTKPQAERRRIVRTKAPSTADRHRRKTRYAKERQPQPQPRRLTVILRITCCGVSPLASYPVSPRIFRVVSEQSSSSWPSTEKIPKTRPRRRLNRPRQRNRNSVINLSNHRVRTLRPSNSSGAGTILACRSLAGRPQAARWRARRHTHGRRM